MNYKECVEYILNIPKFSREYVCEDTTRYLKKMNTDSTAKIIHVAGTNGKGSTCAYIYSILRKAGYSVGFFSSPHLVSINERIGIDGKNISDDEFLNSFENVYESVLEEGGEHHPSFFAFIFLMAMDYYKRQGVDYIILETGLGGRLDATNAVANKCLTVITEIGYDHMEYLGNTITDISYEKAGIIKEGTPVCYWRGNNEASAVFEEVSKRKQTTCYSIEEDAIQIGTVTKESIDFSISCDYYNYDGLKLHTCAIYQVKNAALAVLACHILADEKINEEAIRQGLEEAFWPGRMEEILPGIYLDGAHNENGIDAFISSVSRMNCTGTRRLLFSVVSDKQYDAMIAKIVSTGLFEDFYIAPIASSRTLSIEELRKMFAGYDEIKTHYFNCVEDAFNTMVEERRTNDLVFVVGSLYLVGQIKSLFV